MYTHMGMWLICMCVGHKATLFSLISAARLVFFIRPAFIVFTSHHHQSSLMYIRKSTCLYKKTGRFTMQKCTAGPSAGFDLFALIANITTGAIILPLLLLITSFGPLLLLARAITLLFLCRFLVLM